VPAQPRASSQAVQAIAAGRQRVCVVTSAMGGII
jgi:hypothetical protein